jgi:hypothetical protein
MSDNSRQIILVVKYPRVTKKRGPGQPPKGLKPGEKVSEYHQLTIRVPDATVTRLAALVRELEQPRWRIVNDAITEYAERHLTGRKSTPKR